MFNDVIIWIIASNFKFMSIIVIMSRPNNEKSNQFLITLRVLTEGGVIHFNPCFDSTDEFVNVMCISSYVQVFSSQ